MVCFRLRNGETASSVIKALGGCYSVFFKNVDGGESVEDALSKAISGRERRRNIPRIFFKGVPISEIFKTNSSKYVQVMTAIRNGKSIEDAVKDATVKKCPHCGEYHQRGWSRYCCDECRYMDKTKEVECSWCGKLFRVTNQQAKRKRKYGIFCCQRCSNEARKYSRKRKNARSTYHFKYDSYRKRRV